MEKFDAKAALDLSFEHRDSEQTMTIREYMKELVWKVLSEGESFSGKRPWGNSGWEGELAVPLIKNKVMKGKLDEGIYAYDYSEKTYHKLLGEMVDAL